MLTNDSAGEPYLLLKLTMLYTSVEKVHNLCGHRNACVEGKLLMDHPHEPTWIPYSPPSPSPLHRLLRRYGFAGALVLFAGLIFGGLVLGSSKYASQQPPAGAFRPAGPPLTGQKEVERPFAGDATLTVATEPGAAVVQIDRQIVGRAPLRGRVVPAGVHLLTVLKEGYAPMDSVIILRTGAHPHLSITLQPLPGYTPGADPSARAAAHRPRRFPLKIEPLAPHIEQGWPTSDSARAAHFDRAVERALKRRPAPTDAPLGW